MVAVLVVVGATLIPVRTAWSAPATRLAALPVAAGEVVLLPHQSSHLAVRWIGGDDDRLELRWRSGAAPWNGWQPLEVSHDLGDEAQGIVLSGLLVVSDATQAEVRTVGGAPGQLELVAIDTAHGPRRLVAARARPAPAAAAARVAQPAVISRATWGADESIRKPEQSFAPVTRMAVHHTVTSNDDPDPAATMRAIYSYHVSYNGWNDIGYNFVVDAQGRIYEGRYARTYAPGEIPTGEDLNGQLVTGAHVADNNSGTVGVALLGDFKSVQPPPAALASLQRLLSWEADRHAVDPNGLANWTAGVRPTIIGHRDVGATACPGDNLYAALPAVRRAIAETLRLAGAAPKVVTGYWMLGRDGAVYPFGDAPALGANGPPLLPPAVSMASTPNGKGYWILSSSGRVTPYGDAGFFGSTEGVTLNAPAVRLEPTASGLGYWVLGADGGVFSFGDAAFQGSTGDLRLNAPVIGMSSTPSGRGYWLLAADGGVFTFGDGSFYGSTGDLRLNAPVVSMAPHPSGFGYWLQASDGGIFSFGQVGFYGSVPGLGLVKPARSVQIRVGGAGAGYYVLGADGGIFTFGDLRFYGAQPDLGKEAAAVDLALRLG